MIRKKKSGDSVKKYIVVRNGFKVSENEYGNKEDAADEYGFWNRVITNHSPSCKLEIVEKSK